jgi:hypothetical protein
MIVSLLAVDCIVIVIVLVFVIDLSSLLLTASALKGMVPVYSR